MIFAPSHEDLEVLARALGTSAVVADIAGDRPLADTLIDATRRYVSLPPAQRRAAVRDVRRGTAASSGGWPQPEAAAMAGILDAGPREALQSALEALPADLALLLQPGDLDPIDIVAVHRRHGVVSGADIAAILVTADRTGESSDDPLRRLASRLPWLQDQRRRLPLGRAVPALERMVPALAALPGVLAVEPLGSLRRYGPTIGDLELLVVSDDPAAAIEAAVGALEPAAVRHVSRTRAVVQAGHHEVGLRSCREDQAAALLLWHTGSPAHVRLLRERAAGAGIDIRPRGWIQADGRPLPAATEAQLYAHLSLPLIAPELRHGGDEIERAASGRLPSLVTVDDVRGDLHTHTLWSDGRDSVDAIVFAARALGYEYVAITDHSPSAAAARVLSLERLQRQAVEVARIREAVPGITVLHGVEVDILEDGSLDLPEAVLAGLDLVLASLHEPFGHPPARLLERYACAARHPLVSVITHPANRVPGRDEGYALDFDALFRLAADTGTAVEVDGGPGHLDLDGHLARRAVELGATLTIDSDGHDASRLGRQMRLGVGTARRGGVTAAQVLNTRPLAEVRQFIARKRQRRF